MNFSFYKPINEHGSFIDITLLRYRVDSGKEGIINHATFVRCKLFYLATQQIFYHSISRKKIKVRNKKNNRYKKKQMKINQFPNQFDFWSLSLSRKQLRVLCTTFQNFDPFISSLRLQRLIYHWLCSKLIMYTAVSVIL